MEEKKKSSKRFLIIYCIAIFAFAVALILIASVSQARSAREADEIQRRLTNAEVIATDSKTRLDAVMTENSRLKNTIEELTKENETLKTQKEESDKRILASQKLSELMEYKMKKKTKLLKSGISAFEAGGFYDYLSAEEQKRYNYIK